MAFVAPIAFALAGSAIFGTFGMATIGASVGWLVGSWLFQPKQQSKNQILDPGAQEMPRFNTATRGATMPVLFGTNRVPCQIVWQHDFTTVRKETKEGGEGGGKFGGSGMKGGAGTNSTISYQYKWDMVYHLGMTPENLALYGGWIGPDKISGDSIMAIQNNAAGQFNVFFGFTGAVQVQHAQKASLTFEEGFFYQGYGNGTDGNAADVPGWDEITSDEGIIIRWPHTVWVGFKQLDLGGMPHVPQLSFEVGPGQPEITFDSNYIGTADDASATTPSTTVMNFIIGDDGHKYIVSGGAGVCATIWRYNSTAQTFVFVDTITATEFNTEAHAFGLDPGVISSFTSNVGGGPVPNTNYFLAWGMQVGTGTTSRYAFLLYKMDSNGSRVAVGGYETRGAGLGVFLSQEVSIGLANESTEDDPILIYGINQVGAIFHTQFWMLPSITQFLEESPLIFTAAGSMDATTQNVDSIVGLRFGLHGTYRPYTSFGWFLPSVTFVLGLIPEWETRWYFFVGKSDTQYHIDFPAAADVSSYINTNKTTYPNGHIGFINLGNCEFSTVSGAGLYGTLSPVVEVDHTKWIGYYDENARVPFDDGSENRDGTGDNEDDYDAQPCATRVTEGQAQGAYLCMFSKHFNGSEDLSPSGEFTKVRGFFYNPLSTKFKEFATAEGSTLDTVSDVGATEPNRYNYTIAARKGIFLQSTEELYLYHFFASGASAPLDGHHLTKFGSFEVGGGTDVLPPWIIYEILTNEWFGLGIPTSFIDQSSYQEALLYCDALDFRVSTQYRREQSALSIIEEVLSVYGGFLVISNGQIKFRTLEFESSPVRTIDNHHLMTEGEGEQPVTIAKGAQQDTFNKVRVNYIDRNLDYQQNQVEDGDEVDQDLFGIRMREFPASFVMSENTARTMAVRALWSNLYAKDTYNFKLGWKDADLEPGDVITLVDSHHPNLASGVTARITLWHERKRGIFDVTAKREYAYISAASAFAFNITSGSAQDLVNKVPSPRYFRMYELPAEFQVQDAGMLYAGWVPDEFAAGAYLWISPDGETFAEAARVEPYPLGGKMLTSLPNVPAGTINENIQVTLFPKSDWTTSNQSYYFEATLNEAGPAVRAIGGALIWVGSEMIAYENVTLLGQNRYQLGKVYRGWGGTHIHSHGVDDFWFKHGGGIFTQSFNEDKFRTTIQYKVQPYNLAGVRISIDSINAQTYTILGAHYRPQVAPTPRFVTNSTDFRGKTTVYVASTIDIPIDWRDSARKAGFGTAGFGTGGYGRFTVDPLSHSWRVEVVGSGGLTVRSTVVTTATFNYTSSLNFADNGAWRGNLTFRVTPFSAAGDAPRTEALTLELWT